MKRVLLTGAAGFVGRHCIQPLRARDFEIHAVTTRTGADAANVEGVVWHCADLLDHAQVEALLEKTAPTHLLHVAWFVQPGDYWSSPLNYKWLEATLHLLDTFAAHGGVRAVLIGTGAEYDPASSLCVEGTTPLLPRTIYGACKASLSLLLPAAAAQLGLSAAWSRLFYLYGAGEKPVRLVPSVIRALLGGHLFAFSEGEQVRDYLYVQDAADALVALLDSEVTLAVNVASGEGITLRRLVAAVGDQMERGDLIRFGAKPMPPDEPLVQVADVSRLREEVGWQPQVGLDEGIRRTVEWWKTANG